jgi:transposase
MCKAWAARSGVSKQRAVILAVVVEGFTQAEAARRYNVSEATVSRIVARYRSDGDAAFEPRSQRPHSSPSRIDTGTVELIVNLRKELSMPVSTPGRSPSPGTSTSATT